MRFGCFDYRGSDVGRIRTIKPEFFTSEDIVSLSPLARLLYIAAWCEADREGRLFWKPRTMKLRYLPDDDCDIELLCAEVVSRGLVKLYGEGLAYIPSFSEHQHVNPREAASTLPQPDASARVRTRRARDPDAQVGKERKGKERKEIDASGDALPDCVPAELWAELVKHRKAIGKPMTAQASTRMLGKLVSLHGEGVNLGAAIDSTIRNGWQDVFAPKIEKSRAVAGGNPWDGAL